jgi:hypothetical protein
MLPAFFSNISNSSSYNREVAARLYWRLVTMAHNSGAAGSQQRPRGVLCSGLDGSRRIGGQLLFIILIVDNSIGNRDPRNRPLRGKGSRWCHWDKRVIRGNNIEQQISSSNNIKHLVWRDDRRQRRQRLGS